MSHFPLRNRFPVPRMSREWVDRIPMASWQIPNTKLTIARMTDGPQKGEYLFSSGTVQQAVEFYEEIKRQPYRTGPPPVSEGLHDWYLSAPAEPIIAAWVDTLPDVFRTRHFSMAIWQWLGLLPAPSSRSG